MVSTGTMPPPLLTTKRRLPWLCGCADATVFGHQHPCVLWESQANQARPGWVSTNQEWP